MRVLFWLICLTSPLIAADFEISKNEILVHGEIVEGDEFKLRDMYRENPDVDTIAFKSRGGDLLIALRMGNFIRRNKLNTMAFGDCMSACSVAFIGGKERSVRESGALGFHRVLNADENQVVALDDPLYNKLTQYAWSMGVNPISFVQWISAASPKDIHFPSLEALCEAKVLSPCED